MAPQPEQRYEGMSPRAFEHPADRAATAALRSVPLVERVVKVVLELGQERRLRQLFTGNSVQVSDQQLAELWAVHAGAASTLDVAAVPDLFVSQTPMASGLTVGTNRPMVVLSSGLVTDYGAAEVQAVVGHEMGHVLCRHNYYQTALQLLAMLLSSGSQVGPVPLVPLRAVHLVLAEWARAAELSADRASALVVGDPLVTCRMLMHLAGGSLPGMSLDAFLAQAARYEEEEDLLSRWSRAWAEAYASHPFALRRAHELMAWVEGGSFDRLRSGDYVRRGQEPAVVDELQGAVAHYRDRFTRALDITAGGLDKVLRQVEDWLRPPGPRPGGSGEGRPG